MRVIFPRDHGDFSGFFLGQKDCASTASRVALSRAAGWCHGRGFAFYRFWRLSNRAYCLRFSEHTGVETLNSAKNWLKTRIILEKQFAKWYRTIWPCRGLRHRGTPHGRGDQQGDTKPRGLTARENVQCASALRRGQRLPGDGYPSPGSFFLCSFSVLLKISCGFLAFIEKYGILIALVLRRMDRALSGHTMFGAFDAGTAPPHTSTDDLKRGKLP